jgi:hypothetical protein
MTDFFDETDCDEWTDFFCPLPTDELQSRRPLPEPIGVMGAGAASRAAPARSGRILLENPPILASRGRRDVSPSERIRELIGSDIRQKELITLQLGMFKDILPPPTREEKRSRTLNVASFDRHRDEVLALLDSPDIIREVLVVVFESRTQRSERNSLLAHANMLP